MLNKNRTLANLLIIILLLFTVLNSKSNAEFQIQDIGVTKSQSDSRIDITDSILANKRLLQSSLSGSYDMRNDIKIRVKNQSTSADCWSFSTLSALETYFQMKYNETYDFSERHLNYATTREFLDGINETGYNRTTTGGGNAILGYSYMTSGKGPINESDMPFTTDESEIELSEIQGKKVQKKLNDYIVFKEVLKTKKDDNTIVYKRPNGIEYSEADVLEIRNKIKKHLLTNGGVTADTRVESKYYNFDAKVGDEIYPAYYCDGDIETNTNIQADHQITIIGWNDNYSKENFNKEHRPVHDGAYLVLNSHGDKTTNSNAKYPEGLYYISYDDVFIESGCTGIIDAGNIDYDHLYQYDPLGTSIDLVISHPYAFGANVFTKQSSGIEELNEISVAMNNEAKCDVYVNLESDELPLDKMQLIKEKVPLKKGYTTIKFDKSYPIKGDKFVVAVKYISLNNKNSYIGVEKPNILENSDNSTDFWKYATSNSGESYIGTESTDGTEFYWVDVKEYDKKLKEIYNQGISEGKSLDKSKYSMCENCNICIKAFTSDLDVNEITSNQYKIENENILGVSPYTKFEDFIKNIKQSNIKVLKIDNSPVNTGENMQTGMKATIDDSRYYNVIVKGDLNGDGIINIGDTVAMKMFIVGEKKLEDAFEKAADIDGDNMPARAKDLAKLVDYQLGIIENL